MGKRVGCTELQRLGEGNLSWDCKLTSQVVREALVGAGVHAQQPGVGKLVRVAEGGKLHRRGGKSHFPCELLTNMAAGRSNSTI
jgi:hypothetical protein